MAGRQGVRARQIVGSGLASVLLLALVACGDDGNASADDDASSSSSSGGGDDTAEDVVVVDGPQADVNVIDNDFDPPDIQIHVGTKVVWTNNGRQDHDIVAVDDGAGFGVRPPDFLPDGVYEYTFDQPGTYRYYCSLHGTPDAGMAGTVIVQDD